MIYRLIEEMKTGSSDTELEQTLDYYCIMASKPEK